MEGERQTVNPSFDDMKEATALERDLVEIPESLPPGGINLERIVSALEGRFLKEALKQTGGNKQAAAKLLGLKRTTFAAKLRRCGSIHADTSGDEEED